MLVEHSSVRLWELPYIFLMLFCGKSQNKDALLWAMWPLVASHSEKRDSIGIPVTMWVEWVFRAQPAPIRPHYLNQLLSVQLIDKGSPIWRVWRWNGSKIRLKAFLLCRPPYIYDPVKYGDNKTKQMSLQNWLQADFLHELHAWSNWGLSENFPSKDETSC